MYLSFQVLMGNTKTQTGLTWGMCPLWACQGWPWEKVSSHRHHIVRVGGSRYQGERKWARQTTGPNCDLFLVFLIFFFLKGKGKRVTFSVFPPWLQAAGWVVLPWAGSEGRWCSLQKCRRYGLKAQLLTYELKKAENEVAKQMDTTLNLCAWNLQEFTDGLQVVLKTQKL